jgi:hypothetical protein
MTEPQIQGFVTLVREMRVWQQVHATTGSPEARQRALELEVVVDNALDGLRQQDQEEGDTP